MSNKLRNVKGFTLIELMVVVAIIGIILAIAIPYYISYKRTSCDRAATSDIGKAAACLERLANELVDLNLKFDNDTTGFQIYTDNLLQYLVGPYYGFRGGTRKCDVMIRISEQAGGRYVIQSCSGKGSHPAGQDTRYIYGAPLAGGGDLPATVDTGCQDAGDQASANWNAYPITDAGVETCYTESIVDPEQGAPDTLRSFTTRDPGSVNCKALTGND